MILVTGASGFIGSHLVPQLASFARVRSVVRPGSGARLPQHPSVEVFEHDLSSPEGLEKAVRGVDCVVHSAALTRKEKISEIWKVNVEATRMLVDASRAQGVKRFLFISTENVLREDIHDAYAETKREAENIVRELPGSLILRPCFLYGAGNTHGLGRLLTIAQKMPVVPLFGGLKSLIQPIYIDDMTEYLVRGVQRNISGEFVVAGSDTLSINDFILKALAVRGIKKSILSVPRWAYAAAAFVADHVLRSSGWGSIQMKNIYNSKTYPINKTVEAFGFIPRALNAGLKEWLA